MSLSCGKGNWRTEVKKTKAGHKQDKELKEMIRIAKEKGYKVRNVGIDDYGKFYLVISQHCGEEND